MAHCAKVTIIVEQLKTQFWAHLNQRISHLTTGLNRSYESYVDDWI